MTRDDIIRMAREAGLGFAKGTGWGTHAGTQRFAALVAAHKTEVAIAEAYRCGFEAGVVEEREGVWNILFEYAGREDLSDSDQSLLKHLADLIRNRGKK